MAATQLEFSYGRKSFAHNLLQDFTGGRSKLVASLPSLPAEGEPHPRLDNDWDLGAFPLKAETRRPYPIMRSIRHNMPMLTNRQN
jgi:hypothetical protein